ncbi:MAG: Tn3 family transposase [Proteobacteria bacterium]|nr:Tn3 family transposase [Pseudomonadota bacterium]
MSSIERTAYPRYPARRKIKQKELCQYTLTHDEIDLMKTMANTSHSHLNFAIQLKTFQRLGYFISIDEVPDEIVHHIRLSLKLHHRLKIGYQSNTTLYSHRTKIRQHMKVKRWGSENIDGQQVHAGMKLAVKYAYETSHTMNNIPDIINAVIEHLLQSNFELPVFNTLDRLVRHSRHAVNNKLFRQAFHKLSENQISQLNDLLKPAENGKRSLFNKLKEFPKRPSIKKFQKFLEHFHWLESFNNILECLHIISKVKIEQFAEEAKNMSADEFADLSEAKRYTLITSLIYTSQIDAKDALSLMLCRLIAIAHKQSHVKLENKLKGSQEDSCDVAELLKKIALDRMLTANYCKFAKMVIENLNIAGGCEAVANKCEDILISHGKEHRIFLSEMVHKRRPIFIKLLKSLKINSSTQDDNLVMAINFVLENESRKSELIDNNIDLSFATDFWKRRIIKTIKGKTKLNRKELETCIFEFAVKGLNSGDLHVKGAQNYDDYRASLMPWDECKQYLDGFCQEIGIANNAKDMIKNLREMLTDKAKYVDDNYHEIPDFVINEEDGRPVLKKYDAKPKSESAEKLENLIRSRMPERTLLDILSNAQHYIGWADEFGLISGTDSKLDNPIEKYILTTFGYGTGLGPKQTAKHVRTDIEPRTLSRLNKKHISIKKLNQAMTKIINCANDFPLLTAWGDGERCAVDGTFEDINDNNLIAEQHVRYGKKGGVAYHHVADNYIAIFSTFIQCGVWEAINIIDGLLKNASEIQPKIVHSDTQGQSLPVFAFSYLLGIKLMPRIRNWKDLNMYKPYKKTKYKNIDKLFCDTGINWELLETHWEDLMQVIISVKQGRVSSTFILSKLNSYNNQNKLYKAFHELGKVIRTTFLLEYIADKELRQIITATTNKVESYNGLSDWIRFGSSQLVASNDPDEMEKSIKYNTLIANCIMLQNVVDITDICHELQEEGYKITKDDVSYMSPYMTEHLKRFGEYVLDLNKMPRNLGLTRAKVPF